MKITEKIHSIFKVVKSKEVKGAEVWLVTWNARYGEYHGNYERCAKAFLSYDDALEFAKSLEDAKKLLNYSENIYIKISSQK